MKLECRLQIRFLLAVLAVLARYQGVAQLDLHTLPNGLQSVNGSYHNGGCIIVQGVICVELDEGGTSDLTDCAIPSLGGFQSNWAAGLFTVNRSGQPSFHIGFEFSRPVNFTRVELDLFNCPEWGIAAQTITVYEYNFGILNFVPALARALNLALGNTTVNTISCTSIVRVVIPLELPQNPATSYVIDFTFDNTATHNQWVHIAEVRFLEEEDTQCPTPSSTTAIQTQMSQHPTTTSTHEHTLSQEMVPPTLSRGTVQPTLSQQTVQPTLSQEVIQPTLSQQTAQPTLSQDTERPTLSLENVRPSLSKENLQTTLSRVQPTLSQEMVPPTPSQKTVQLTLSQETVQPTLSQDSIQATPQTTLPSFPPVAQLNRHTLPDGLQSVNGSDPTGGCSRPVAQGLICVELDEGGTSDLTDCVIPSLGGFQSNWAAGLFTVNRSGLSSFHIGFEFSRPVNFTRVELDLFNCPEWGIAAQTITVYEYTLGILNFVPAIARALGHTTASTTSCTSIVRVVISLELHQNPTPFYIIDFTFDNTATNIQWVHIAEVMFLEEEDTQCPTPSSTAAIQTQMSQHPTTTPTYEHTQSQETVQPTLPQDSVQATPQTTLPDGSPVPIVTAVTVVTLFVTVLGVIVLPVIFVRARRKRQKLEIQKIQSAMIGEAEYEEIQETQLSTLIEMKENDAYQQHIVRASIREPLHTDDVVAYEEVREGKNQGVRFMIIENKAYGCHLQGESPSDKDEYEEI